MAGVPIGFQTHILLAFVVFAVWPFARLIHAFSAVPAEYCVRAAQGQVGLRRRFLSRTRPSTTSTGRTRASRTPDHSPRCPNRSPTRTGSPS